MKQLQLSDHDYLRELAQSRSRIDRRCIGTNVTLDVEVLADDFLPYASNPFLLSRAVAVYADRLYEKLLLEAEMDGNAPLVLSRKHIHDETLAHLLPWFLYARRRGKGRLYRSCREVNLNTDENRLPVRLLMTAASLLPLNDKNA